MNLDWRIVSLNKLYGICFFLTLFLHGCGKKNKHIFSFQQEQKRKHIPIFIMPLVVNISASVQQDEVIITWNPLADSFSYAHEQMHLHSYNVYSFNDASFIPRKASSTQECFYKDKRKKGVTYYTVRGVYMFQGRRLEGPHSKIVSTASF
jgi:hypothetical protein